MSIPQDDTERTLASLRQSLRILAAPALAFIVTVGLIAWLTGVATETWMTILVIAAGVVVLVLACALPLLAWLARRTIITTRKLVVQSGLLVRTRRELLHSRGYDVTVRQTPLQRMLRTGDLQIQAAGSDDALELRDIPNPVLTQAVLNDLVDANVGRQSSQRNPVAEHGANTTDATRRFATDLLDDTQAM